AVDVDADGLEAAGRRVAPVLAARHHAGDQVRQLRGAGDRLLRARGHDRTGDAPALLLLAIAPQDLGDLALVGARQPLGSTLARVGVHAHVQRAVLAEGKAALGHVQLRRGHAQVQQDAVQLARLVPLRHAGEAAAVDRHARIATEAGL